VIFGETPLPGVMLIMPDLHEDERGFFARLYCPAEFAKAGIDFSPTQINLSRNTQSYTLRGLHYQDPPNAEAKLIRVTAGRIFEVVVDLRRGTPTYLKSISLELDARSARAIFVPEGCAHGFMTLEPDTDILYQMGRDHVPDLGRGLRWNDPALGLSWPAPPARVSPADQNWPLLERSSAV
jgi:dTDP-4-dehydrorhamnose 3,5-epimerase